jgi:DNA-directed RNA polymerase specialized sigma24 family protein
MSDELLVVRAQLGNRSALEVLVARWQKPVWLYVRRMLDAERADDVAQEAWIAVVRAPAGTIKSRLNRARRMLREHVEEEREPT